MKHGGMSYTLTATAFGHQRLVRYPEFLGDYWTHFPANITRGLGEFLWFVLFL
jgi:hypothetical protein